MKFSMPIWLSMAALCGTSTAFAQTWFQTSAPITNWVSIASSADGTKLAAAVSLGGIWTSTNSGNSWLETGAPRSAWLRLVSSADGTRLAAIGEPTLMPGPPFTYTGSFYSSTNSGTTWNSNNLPSLPKFGANSYGLASSADGRRLAAWVSSSPASTLFTSTNSGSTWITNTLPSGAWDTAAFSADGTRLLVGGSGILVSTNSGSSWMLTNTFPASCVSLSADGAKGVAVSKQLIGQLVYTSTNSGTTWTPTSAPATNWIALASSADGCQLVVVAGGKLVLLDQAVTGPIYTSTNSGATWKSNNVPVHNWTCVTASADGCKLVAADTGILSSNVPGATVGGGIWTAHISPTPSLKITPTNGNFRLSWIVPSTDFVLEQSTGLAGWSEAASTPALNLTNLQDEATLSPIGNSGFYRLKTP